MGRQSQNLCSFPYIATAILLKNLVLPALLIATAMQVIEEPEELAEDLCEARCSDLEQRKADRYFDI